MPSDWQPLTLSTAGINLIDCDHRTPAAVEQGHPYIAIPQLKDGRIDLQDARRISSDDLASWTKKLAPRDHDVVVVRRCNSGDSAVITKGTKCAIGQNLVVLRSIDTLVRPDYLRWLVRGDEWWEQVRKYLNVGAVFDSLKCRDIPNFEVLIPPRDEQKEISATLSALDDQIDLLRQTNTTLEAIAQTIFKSWFLDFDPVHAKAKGLAPEGMDEATAALFPNSLEESVLGAIPRGWRAGLLGDVCENPRSQAKPGTMPPDTVYIGLEHMPRKSIALGAAGTAKGLESGKFWFQRDDVLFGKLRPYFHKVGLAPGAGVCSTDILVVRPKKPDLLGFVAMHMCSDRLVAYTTQLSNGAKMPRTSWQHVESYKVALPGQPPMAAFNEVVRPMFDSIYSNIEEARTLQELRDALLPRLISGKLRIPEAAELIEAVAA